LIGWLVVVVWEGVGAVGACGLLVRTLLFSSFLNGSFLELFSLIFLYSSVYIIEKIIVTSAS
jgi:hypothetical protein